MAEASVPVIPVLRAGAEYESLDLVDVKGCRDGAVAVRVGQANAGLIRRDLARIGERTAVLSRLPVAELLEICRRAGELFTGASLPLGGRGGEQSPDDYVRALSATSGLPQVLCRANMKKVATVCAEMPAILRGLLRGMDPAVIDRGWGEHDGVPVSFAPTTAALGVVLPSNSPGVNSLWMPAVALKIPVVLKPGREEPWTPWRIVQAFIAAGCPREAFSFYPADHEGAAAILEGCGRALLFGDEATTARWAGNPAIQIHGPGRSKIVIGPDAIGGWRSHLDVLLASIADNGGRSCINASTILVPSDADAVAETLARALAGTGPRPPEDPDARLSAFPKPEVAAAIDAAIERGLAAGGARDVTARFRDGPRLVTQGGATYLRPTVLRCDRLDHPLARTEYLFPFASVVEAPEGALASSLGRSLVVTAITRDEALVAALLRSPEIGRLNLGPVPTTRVEWNQPHEGNLFDLLYVRRAIQRAHGW